MKRMATNVALVFAVVFVLIWALGTAAFAHGNNDHVRGVVTQISAQSITVQLANKTSKTLTLSAKTTFERAGKPAGMNDLKVGDRVVIDVPKNTSEALEVQIGAALKPAAK
jgi:exosome complex RNA-binding protein Rrp4